MCVRVPAPLVTRHSWLGCAAWVCVVWLGFRLRPATPGWGVRVCACSCARSACTLPLLAGVCGVGVSAWAQVSAAPRHYWLGCWGVCVFVCARRLYPATPDWGVRRGCVFGLRFPLRPATLGWVFGVCVFVCPLRLYPATPGWGVRRGCVCFGSDFGCAPPLLAGVCGCVCVRVPAQLVPRHSWLGRVVCVCVCFQARVSAAPRHSWLGCWGVCVFVCPLRLYTATPRWGVRRGCVCLGSGFSCALPLLAGLLGCVCVFVPAPLVPHHSWLGCVVWVYLFGLGIRVRPASPGRGVGVCVCSCARSACTPPLLAGVCGVGVCVWAWVSAAPCPSWLGCWGVCVSSCPLRLFPITPDWGVWCGCVCLGSGFGCAPPLLAGVLGCVCVRVRAPLVPRHSSLGCAAWVCVFGLGFQLRPAAPGWSVGVCVRLRARSACSPPLLAGVCVACVCVWARDSAAPRHSWLGCSGVCVFVCPLRLYPAIPGWDVRRGCVSFGLGFGCAPPLLAGVLGCVRARARAPLVPCHSWLGCVVWVCVLGLGFRLRPAILGLGVGVCVCSCACSACTLLFLAGVFGVAVCAWAWVSAAPRLSWLGCWGVCVFVCSLRLYPATPGSGVWCVCVCSGSSFGCAPPLLAGVLGCVCVRVPAPLVPRHSWLGCAVWVCVFGLGFRLRPAALGWDVGVCVCLCTRSACTPPFLAWVGGVGVCAWARVSAAPRHSWLGCWGVCVFVCALRLYPATPGWGVWCGCVCLGSGFGCALPLLAGVLGCVCVCVRAPLVPRHSWLGCAAWVCGLGVVWHPFPCRGSLRVMRGARVCGTHWPLSLGTCPCAAVLASGGPLWRALWPRVGASRLVRSGRSRCFGWLS